MKKSGSRGHYYSATRPSAPMASRRAEVSPERSAGARGSGDPAPQPVVAAAAVRRPFVNRRRRIAGVNGPPPRPVVLVPAVAGGAVGEPRVVLTKHGDYTIDVDVTVTDPDELGLAPLTAATQRMVSVIASGLDKNVRTTVNAVMTWATTTATNEEESDYTMNLSLLSVSAVCSGASAEQHVRVLLRELAQASKDKMEWAAARSSQVAFVRIKFFRLTLVTGHREQLMGPPPPAIPPREVRGGNAHALPQDLVNRKCCLNIQNKDDFCFRYCMIAWTQDYKKGTCHNASRPSNYITNAPANGKFPNFFVPEFIDCQLSFHMLTFPTD